MRPDPCCSWSWLMSGADGAAHVSLGFRFGGAGRHHIGAPLQRCGLAEQQRPALAAQHHPLASEQGLPTLAPLLFPRWVVQSMAGALLICWWERWIVVWLASDGSAIQ